MRDQYETYKEMLTRAIFLEMVAPTEEGSRKMAANARRLALELEPVDIEECFAAAIVRSQSEQYHGRS